MGTRAFWLFRGRYLSRPWYKHRHQPLISELGCIHCTVMGARGKKNSEGYEQVTLTMNRLNWMWCSKTLILVSLSPTMLANVTGSVSCPASAGICHLYVSYSSVFRNHFKYESNAWFLNLALCCRCISIKCVCASMWMAILSILYN